MQGKIGSLNLVLSSAENNYLGSSPPLIYSWDQVLHFFYMKHICYNPNLFFLPSSSICSRQASHLVIALPLPNNTAGTCRIMKQPCSIDMQLSQLWENGHYLSIPEQLYPSLHGSVGDRKRGVRSGMKKGRARQSGIKCIYPLRGQGWYLHFPLCLFL